MNNYELVFIVQPDLDKEGVVSVLERFTTRVESFGGEIASFNTWGKRRLAFPIRKFHEGYYYILDLAMDPERLLELERFIKLTEPILRYMIMRQQEPVEA